MSQSGRTDGSAKLLMVIKGPTLPNGKKQLKMNMDVSFGSIIKTLKQSGKLYYNDGTVVVDPRSKPQELGFEAGKMVVFEFRADEGASSQQPSPQAANEAPPPSRGAAPPPSALMPKPAAAASHQPTPAAAAATTPAGGPGAASTPGSLRPTDDHPGGAPPKDTVGTQGGASGSNPSHMLPRPTGAANDGAPPPAQAKPQVAPTPVPHPQVPHKHHGDSPTAKPPAPTAVPHPKPVAQLQPAASESVASDSIEPQSQQGSVAQPTPREEDSQSRVIHQQPKPMAPVPAPAYKSPNRQPQRESPDSQVADRKQISPAQAPPAAQPPQAAPAPAFVPNRRESPTARFHAHNVKKEQAPPQPQAEAPPSQSAAPQQRPQPAQVPQSQPQPGAMVGQPPQKQSPPRHPQMIAKPVPAPVPVVEQTQAFAPAPVMASAQNHTTQSLAPANVVASPPRVGPVSQLSHFSLGPGRPTSHGPPRRTVTATNVAAPPPLNPWPNDSPLDMYGASHGLGPGIHPSHPGLQKSQAGEEVSSRHSVLNNSSAIVGGGFDQSHNGLSPVRPLSHTPAPHWGTNNTSPQGASQGPRLPNSLPPQAPPGGPQPVQGTTSPYRTSNTVNSAGYHAQRDQHHNSSQAAQYTQAEVDALKDEITLLRAELELEKAHREQLGNVVKQLAQSMHNQDSLGTQDLASKEHVKLMEQLREQRQASRASRSNSLSPHH